MTIRFFRSIRILPGLRLLVSKSGVGFSAGFKRLHFGRSTRGHNYVSVSAPGGVSARQEFKRRAK